MNRARRRIAKRRRALRGLRLTVFSAGGSVGKIRAWDHVAKSIRASVDECEDAPAAKSGEGWDGEIEGFCPVQAAANSSRPRCCFSRRPSSSWRSACGRTTRPGEPSLGADVVTVTA